MCLQLSISNVVKLLSSTEHTVNIMLHTFTLHRTDRFNEYVYLINTFRVLLISVKCILTSFCFVNLSKLKPPYFIRIKDFLAPNVIYHEIDNPPTPFPVSVC